MPEFTVSQHFSGKDPAVQSIYERILAESSKFGKIIEEPKKTSIHLVNKSAFAGIRTQKAALILNVKSAAPIKDKRFAKSERLSANRYHQEVKLTSPNEVDAALVGWLKEAYEMSG
jgi:hypothetical protein